MLNVLKRIVFIVLAVLFVGSVFYTSSMLSAYLQKEAAVMIQAQGTGAQGTGFFVSNDGWIMTNKHVVQLNKDQHAAFVVVDYKGQFVPAKVVWISPTADLALIKIDVKTYNCVSAATNDYKSDILSRGILIRFGNFKDVIDFGTRERLLIKLTAGQSPSRIILSLSHQALVELNAITESYYKAVLVPGNSGSPVVDPYIGKLIAVGNSGVELPGHTTSFGVRLVDINKFLNDMLRLQHTNIQCSTIIAPNTSILVRIITTAF